MSKTAMSPGPVEVPRNQLDHLGAWGVEGALSGMVSGRVSAEFAKEHHDLWYERVGRKTEAAEEKPARNSRNATDEHFN